MRRTETSRHSSVVASPWRRAGLSRALALGKLGGIVIATLSIAGCAGQPGSLLTSGSVNDQARLAVTDYVAASMLSPMGHSVSGLADGRVRVTATGSATTPVDRLQKIALARAAEYGSVENKKFFQATAPVTSYRCQKGERLERGHTVKQPTRAYTVVTVDVTYAPNAVDTSYQPTKATAAAIQQEILAQSVPPDVQAANADQVVAQCSPQRKS